MERGAAVHPGRKTTLSSEGLNVSSHLSFTLIHLDFSSFSFLEKGVPKKTNVSVPILWEFRKKIFQKLKKQGALANESKAICFGKYALMLFFYEHPFIYVFGGVPRFSDWDISP